MRADTGQKGVELLNAGFKIVPIKAGEKDPRTRGWSKMRATLADVNKWRNSSYYGGWGVLGEFTPGIDIDVSDTKIVGKLLSWCRKHIGAGPIRVGNNPRLLLPCSPPKGYLLGSDASNKYTSLDGKEHQVEIKASGRQWVAYGVHPKTKKEYVWHVNNLENVSPKSLPVLNGDLISALFDYFYSIAPNSWQIKSRRTLRPQGSITSSGEIVGAVSFENYKPPLDIEADKLRSMLAKLNPDAGHDTWVTVGMALYHQFGGGDEGKNLFIEWSERSEDFDAEEIETRWPSWGDNTYSGNPITAATIVKYYQTTLEKTKDPTVRKKSNKLSDWEKRFALVELPDGSEVHDMAKPIWQAPRRTLAAFKEHNAAYSRATTVNGVPKVEPMVDAWRSSLNTRHFSGFTYQPGKKRYCPAEFNFGDPALYINTFFFPPHGEVESGEIKDRVLPFIKFLSHLFPEKKECRWIVMWLARMIQKPGTRSFVTPLNITPVTGTGRGLFFEIIRILIGGHNCHDVSRDDLEGRFNGYLDKCIVAVVQEIKSATGDRKYQMWERMKSLLADSTANIQSKGRDSYTATIRANFILFSNNINALPIEDVKERRIYAMRGAGKPIAAPDVEKLLAWMNEPINISALFCFLKSFPVDFDAFKRAKVTETKRQMVIASAGEGKADLISWLNTEAPPVFDFDYAIEKLSDYSQDILESGISRHALRQSITDQGWCSTRIAVDSRRVYIYYDPKRVMNDRRKLRAEFMKLEKETDL